MAMTGAQLLPGLLIALGGVAIAVQAPINAGLARGLGSTLAAAAVSFGVGFVALAALTLLSGSGAFGRLGEVQLWQLVGGVLGAFYVWSMVSVVSGLGVVTAMAALVFGQLSAALILDHIGAFGMTVQTASPQRILAILLVGAGLVLSRF